jgi:hypothetical protein
MIKNREKIIKDFKIKSGNTKANVVRVSVSYNVGGWNYFTGNKERRGLFLHVSPLEIKENSIGYVGFSGSKMFVKEMKRYSEKVLKEFVPTDSDVEYMLGHVLSENEIILEDE